MSKRIKHNHFESGRGGWKGTAPVYKCGRCGKMTRETGEDESSLELCAYCLLISYAENGFNDGVLTKKQYDAEITRLNKKYKRTLADKF
jgi:hypothetical protein